MKLTNNEQRIIEAYRAGAVIDVDFHMCRTPNEAIEKMNIMGAVDNYTDHDDVVILWGELEEEDARINFNAFLRK